MRKLIPYLILAIFFVLALVVNQYRQEKRLDPNISPQQTTRTSLDRFRDPNAEYFFTKHARCRMECRKITQKEVKEIVQQAKVNYEKSDLQDPKGPTYAMEGYTSRDQQHIRVIVAPKTRHLSIVTVIDLDKDWECPSCQ